MKLVILGAGASYDSFYETYDDGLVNQIWKPPLANDLFGGRVNIRNIYYSYTGARRFASEANLAQDIEVFFQDKWDYAEKYKDLEMQSALVSTQYYLQHLFHAITENFKNIGYSNYDLLISKANEYSKKNNEDILFVTFNYDLLLEDSYLRNFPTNNDFLSIDEYYCRNIKIYKPHGSCNWHRRFNENVFSENVTTQIQKQGGVIEYFNNRKEPFQWYEENLKPQVHATKNYSTTAVINNKTLPVYPQILIPIKTKDEFVMPKEHYESLMENLPKVDSILIVGWKGAEDKFKNLLSTTIGDKQLEVVVVNAGDDSPEKELTKYLKKARFNHFIKETKLNKNAYSELENKIKVKRINHKKGSFSSYIMNIDKEGFFS